ncbi:hypothetical protein L4Z64_001485 [Pseudomonas aeruginosa]|nr:hypothetical protein [Pseudomonas aeruginosa]
MSTTTTTPGTKERAIQRIEQIFAAKSERDADHYESDAMGYLAALRDERLLSELDYSQLITTLHSTRLLWRKPA